MLHIDVSTGRVAPGLRAISPPQADHQRAVVHIVDADADVQQLLTHWLAAAGIESRAHAHLGAFLDAHRADLPGCLVIDAQPSAISGLEPQAILLPLAICCRIVVTAYQADVAMAVRAMRTGAIDFVEKPLREWKIVAAICTAIELDRQQRLIASRHAEVRARFATLSPRERQVMALVTAGRLNKQIGGELGVSEITVKAHRGAAMRKMGARSLADLVRMADAIGEGLTAPPRSESSTPARNVAAADRRSGYSPAPER
jgi:FixJ family two-component response regulator